METRRVITPQVIPGQSVTRFHLMMENAMFPDETTELHVAHHTHGDLSEPADWYNIYEHPTEWQLELARTGLNIGQEDWVILEHMLGSFKWVVYSHVVAPNRAEIRVDVPAMKRGEWATTYF